jgi:hypothetical protein
MVDGEGGLKVMDASEPATLKVVGSFDTLVTFHITDLDI